MHAIILCGIQASGKSTYARRHWSDTHVYLSLDLLRTRQRETVLLHACLSTASRFVIDNTNPARAQRKRYLALARAAGYESVELYYFRMELDAALARNAQRPDGRRVPEIAIRGTLAKLEPPGLEEGWDRLVIVQTGADGHYQTETLPT